MICKEGDQLQYVYFVKNGEYKLIKKSEQIEEKERQVFDIIKKHKNKSGKILNPFKLNEMTNAK